MRILRVVAALGVAAGLAATPSTGVVGTASTFDLGPSAKAEGAAPLANFQAEGDNLIRLLAGAFDPAAGSLPAGSGIGLRDRSTLPADLPQYWLVQVRDQRYAEVVSAVSRAGGQIAGTVPDGTYMVRATPAQRDQIASSDAVRWAGYYQPAWRIPVAAAGKPGLLELSGRTPYRVHAFSDDPARGAVGRALKQMDGVKVLRDEGAVVDIEATSAQIPAIAALPAVEWIGTPPRIVPHNMNARWVNDTGVRDLYAATAPGRLNGAGQTAAVADTGVNYKLDLNGRAHVNFRDCDAAGVCKEAIYTQTEPGNTPAEMESIANHNTGHRKMVAYFDLGDAGPNMYDESSHGTHTGGSIDGDKPPYGTWQSADGMAPAAKHVHQNIATTSGGLGGLPANEYNMFRQAYRPRNPAGVPTAWTPADYSNYVPTEDARTHNNSWGSITGVVDDGTAMRFDQFVWDHEDMVIVVSAGNGGPGAGTVNTPTIAKNDLTSGASANGRQPMVSIDSMAAFSSHGPTLDGRFAADLATPGQIVVSSKGGTVDDEHTAQGTSMSAPVLTGLSTLVRQYFYDGYGPAGGKGFAGGAPNIAARRHNPSAALVKATLTNGAERMRGWYTGDDGQVRGLDGQWPSAGQGFGRVNLDNSLYFSNDPTNNWYQDVWRSDAEAFAAGVGSTRSYLVNVQAGSPLDVTLGWTDAPSLLPAGTPALVNNLNLTVTGPGGTYVGNNMNSRATPGVTVAETTPGLAAADNVNPSERIRIADPPAGTYTITVTGASVLQGQQGFALAASGRISAVASTFTPGPARQRDAAGSPAISNVSVEPISSNTAVVRFTTNEPTTATATAGGTTYVDSYNVGSGGFPGLNEATIETSAEYGDKPVVGTSHEILMTALSPGQTYSIALAATDLASNTQNASVTHTSPALAYQADAPDIGYFSSGPNGAAQFRTGTQLYAGTSYVDPLDTVAQRHLGAWMFRVPQAVDPNAITGAVVETTSRHNWVVQYTADPQFTVDLLNESVEPTWGSQNYEAIRSAPHTARVFPETGYERGGGQKYAFTFNCSDLAALKSSLSTVDGGERKAAFRYQATQTGPTSLLAMDFGFNRRSSGPAFRPRLLLFTGTSYPTGEGCDANAPAPVIKDIGIQEGLTPGSVTVTWRTDNVSSDSMVLFRERGTTQWTQVGTPARTRIHQVQVQGLDSSKFYEFVVRSRACNAATTTDTNNGAGYDFYRHAPDPGPRTQHGTTFDFETGAEGWTVARTTQDQAGLASEWRRGPTGDASATGWHVTSTTLGVPWYHNFNETTLTAPAPVSFGTDGLAAVEFSMALDSEPTFDFLYVDYSTNAGASWTEAAHFDGHNGHPAYTSTDARFGNPGGPVLVRFRFKSDELLSSPAYLGASIDRVTYASYPNAPPGVTENLPLTGPVPPPSANATGLTAPPTRGGPASAADVAAGTGSCTVAAMRPDLRVSNLVTSDNRPQEGKRVLLSATVTNGGDVAAPASQTEFKRDGTVVLGLVGTPALAPGQSANVSVEWDTRHHQGEHVVRATADRNNAVVESDEANNTGEITVTVRGNRVRNGDFEADADGNAAPDNWQEEDDGQGLAGHNSWSQGGSHGEHSASTTGNGGNATLAGSPTWTSDPVAVTPGETLELATDVRSTALSSAPTAGLVYLGSLGEVLGTVRLITAPLSTVGFTPLEQTVTVPLGVAQVRVVLAGFAATDSATNGTVTFDDVGLFAQ